MKPILSILLICLSCQLFGQKQAANWVFGNSAGLDFNCNPPDTVVTSRSFFSIEGCASISDTNGNLIFYTNGDSVFNKNHVTMPNGFGIGQNATCYSSSTQGSLIVPVPKSDSLFYIFTTDCAENNLSNGFRYSIVDMSLNGGLGDVSVKAVQLIDTVCEKITAVHHANGKDIWVLTHRFNSDEFYAYLVTESGLNATPIISRTGRVQFLQNWSFYRYCMGRGTMKFSPNGKKLVVLTYSDCNIYPIPAEIFDFNDTTGQVDLDFTINDPDSITYYGAAFSNDSRVLYLSLGWHGVGLHQFNMDSAINSSSFLASKKVIYQKTVISNPPFNAGMTLAPNGKIYISTNKGYLDVIHQPKLLDTNCQFEHQSVFLKSCPYYQYSYYGLPNFIESYLKDTFIGTACKDSSWADFTQFDTCSTQTTVFKNLSGPHKHYAYNNWDFGDPMSGASNTSNEANPSHNFTQNGDYQVRLIVSRNPLNFTCKIDTIIKTIRIIDCPKDTIFQDIVLCDGDSIKILNDVYKTAGEYIHVISSNSGLDTILKSKISIISRTYFTQTVNLCFQDSFQVDSKFYHLSGNYSDTLQNHLGCDSVVQTLINKRLPIAYSQNFSFCDTGSIVVGNHVYTSSGNYKDTLISISGCDSVVSTQLFIYKKVVKDTSLTICFGDTFKLNGIAYYTTQAIRDSMKTFRGCDSIMVYQLRVSAQITTDTRVLLCLGDTVKIGNQGVFQIGNYSDTLLSYNGCDSIVNYSVDLENADKCACDDEFRIPNVFSPNGDAYNEYFPEAYREGNSISIYNRWGILVFESKNGNGWDGKNGGIDMPTGTYYYLIEYLDCRGKLLSVSGILSLIR